MIHRFLTYSDAKSDKFWHITLNGCTHTVRFGRVGTVGQTQTKEFATEEDACKTFEKLVREKLKKGYREEGEPGSQEADVQPLPVQEVDSGTADEGVEAHSPVPQQTASSAVEVVPVELGYPPGRSLHLNPEDWFWATWRNLSPLQRPEPEPFNLKDAQTRLGKVSGTLYGRHWTWAKAKISMALSREEAHFWLAAMTQINNQVPAKKLAEELGTQEFSGNPSFEAFCERLFQSAGGKHAHVLVAQQFSDDIYLPLINLFSTAQLVDLFFFVEDQITAMANSSQWNFHRVRRVLVQGFQRYVIPYLDPMERAALRKAVESKLDISQWPTDYYATPSPTFYLAAYLGCPALQALVESWNDDLYCQSGWRHDFYHRPQEIILGLGNAELVQIHTRRLQLSLHQFDEYNNERTAYLRGWLAHTEYAALDVIRDSALGITNKQEAEAFNREVMALVQAPEVAPLMLELMASKAPQVSRQWLEENPSQAIAGLIPIAAERGKLADTATEFLRTLNRKGYGAYIQTCIAHESAEVAAKIQTNVLEAVETEYPPLDDQTTPTWLQEALAVPVKKSGRPRSLAADYGGRSPPSRQPGRNPAECPGPEYAG